MSDHNAPHPYHPYHPLAGCQLKMVRANEHGKTLNDAIDEFTGRNPYETVNDFKPEIGHYVTRFKVREWPDPAWSPIVGDIVYNVRSALDHLAWQLVRRNRRTPTGTTTFPIFCQDPFNPAAHPSVTEYERALKRWNAQTKRMHSGDIALLKLLQPHQRGEDADSHPLARLDQLSKWDKHREFHFAAQSLMDYEFSVKTTTRNVLPRPVYFKPKGEMLKDGEPIARFTPLVIGPNPKLNMNFKLFYDIAFGEGSPLEGLGIKETLVEIGHYVSDVIVKFKLRFDRQDFSPPSHVSTSENKPPNQEETE
jgi:hypothetical protein